MDRTWEDEARGLLQTHYKRSHGISIDHIKYGSPTPCQNEKRKHHENSDSDEQLDQWAAQPVGSTSPTRQEVLEKSRNPLASDASDHVHSSSNRTPVAEASPKKKRKKNKKNPHLVKRPSSPPSQDDITILHKIIIIVDFVHKVAICIDCRIAIPAAHVRMHAVSQHAFHLPAQDILQPILAFLGAVNIFVRPPEPIAPIVGIKVFQGLACTMKDCNYLAVATQTM
ncbi:hypothetical protein P692DRAFT_201866158 [Suillus brevipes Sb2]|nr:hypothetical protein P692DRAFT_201866158 [Suillus brevipes Sb2]